MDDNSSREQLEFLLVSDSNYASYLATAMASILENAPDDERLRFHIVDAGLTPRDAARIESLKSIRPFELTFYRPDLSEYLKLFPKHIGWLPVVCNCRLFLAKYLPKTLDKVLYLDVDLVVLGDLRELWNKRVDDVYFAAAPDRYVTEEHKKTLGLPESRAYFNSGVLLVNVKKWRDEGLAEQAIDVCGEIYDKIRYQDQDVLNVIASRSDYLELDEKWNCHPNVYAEGETRVLHFMGERLKLPRLEILFSYAAKTPYKRLPFQTIQYKVKRRAKKIFCQFASLFIANRERRRAFRNRFNLR